MDAWPPALKDWVAKCLGQMTDANRNEAQTELRQMIQDAFNAQTLWTTDWAGMKLTSLEPKVPSAFNHQPLKRKADPAVSPYKKKKSQAQAQTVEHGNAFTDLSAKEKRARRFEREHEIERRRGMAVDASPSQTPPPPPNNSLTRKTRLQQSTTFGDGEIDVTPNLNFPDWQEHVIVGRSQQLFKDYYRLTDVPDPDNIRPLSVLKRTLVSLVERWKSDPNYNWICSQFKSMRQDMKVQGINTEFTVKVYEIHARMALEQGDLVEFNQCLSQLKSLYADKVNGRRNEFTAYRMLFMLHARQRSELNSLIGELTPEEKAIPEIRHALLLYPNAPNMGGYIMDFFVPRARALALIVMCKAYRTLSLPFIAKELSFERGMDEVHEYLVTLSAAYYSNPNALIPEKLLDTKLTGAALMNVYEEKFSKVAIKGSI